ncbi:MAG TPA: GTPase ObgE, partial [Clostridia bacterium]|nr:GTPase ObgE [Clostridia bacterium]
KFVLNGGPDGGDGGRGGNVVLVADPNMHTLMDFRYHTKFTAESGVDGSSRMCKGKSGEDVVIKVPPGTVVRNAETRDIVADMHEPGASRILLHGGRGGWGNAHFATPTRQAPNFAKPGEKCTVFTLELELKSIADVGLVGYPNVGKSTILSVVTTAKPKIANYHFTTLAPNLGIVRLYGVDFVIADIPGLIEGAHEGAGLGHAFLRHVERTRLLIHVLDISGSEERDPIEDYERINAELRAYGALAERPQIVAANKMDLPGSAENLERLRAHLPEASIFPVSAATHQGFDALLAEVARVLPTLPLPEPVREADLSELVSDEAGFTVRRENESFVVEGPVVQRLLDSVNFDDEDSLNWFHRRLRQLGVIDALRQAGAEEGNTVFVEDMEFDFVE